MPARKTSNHLKLVRGTAQPSRLNVAEIEAEPLADIPPAPEHLDVHAIREWNRCATFLVRAQTLTELDLPALEDMCRLYGVIKKAYHAGMEVNAATETQLRMYRMEFGMTPVSRNRVSKAPDGKKDNPFARNRREKTPKV
jgi:phage terminase small subunit